MITRRGLASPGGLENCEGPLAPPRRPSLDERAPYAVELVARSPDALHVEATRGDVPPNLLGEHPLADWPGLPRFEPLCPVPSLPDANCDDAERARYHREVGLPAP